MKYVVKPGDTLSKIAAKYLGNSDSYTKIMAVNPQILTKDLIKIGQTIEIPVSASSASTSSYNMTKYFEKLKDPKVATAIVIAYLGLYYLYQKNLRTA